MRGPQKKQKGGSAPGKDHGIWSTVQTAITGGWGVTARLVAIMTVAAVLIGALSVTLDWAGIPVSAFLQVIQPPR
jgi:hypothetical protein